MPPPRAIYTPRRSAGWTGKERLHINPPGHMDIDYVDISSGLLHHYITLLELTLLGDADPGEIERLKVAITGEFLELSKLAQ